MPTEGAFLFLKYSISTFTSSKKAQRLNDEIDRVASLVFSQWFL